MHSAETVKLLYEVILCFVKPPATVDVQSLLYSRYSDDVIDYDCVNSCATARASSKWTSDTWPPVLILHFMRWVCEITSSISLLNWL